MKLRTNQVLKSRSLGIICLYAMLTPQCNALNTVHLPLKSNFLLCFFDLMLTVVYGNEFFWSLKKGQLFGLRIVGFNFTRLKKINFFLTNSHSDHIERSLTDETMNIYESSLMD